MYFECKTNFLNVKKKNGVKDPNKTYYSINVFDGNDCCSFNIEESLYPVFTDLEPMCPMKMILEYNPTFNSLRVTDISLVGVE